MRGTTVVAADLGPETLLELLRHDDPVGVLSIFADLALGARAAEIDVRYRLTELERRMREDEPMAGALADALVRVGPDLAALLDPAGQGRGRALFVPLSGGEPTRVSTRLQLANRVVLDERPFIHPLLECVQRGRAAGVVLLARDRAEVLEWRQGQALVLAQLSLEEDEPRVRAGEQQQRRERERGRRFIEEVAAAVGDVADRHDWDRLLITGGGAVVRLLARALPSALRERAILEARHLIDLDSGAIERAVGKRLEHHQHELDLQLVEAIRSAAQAGRGAALGLSEVAAALNEARVDHLVYDPSVRHAGAMTPSGRLVIPPERDPANEPLLPEPRLTERMVERCLMTGASVTPVEGASAALLADAGGVAARLRW